MRNGIMDAFTASHMGYGTAFKGEASNLSFPKIKERKISTFFLGFIPVALRT